MQRLNVTVRCMEGPSLYRQPLDLLNAGRFDEARRAVEQLVAMPATPDADSAILAKAISDLGMRCLERARYADARYYARCAVAFAEAHLSGAEARDKTVAAFDLLQDSCIALGRLSEAHEAGERALGLQIAMHGPASVAAARATQRLGAVLARIGDTRGARAVFQGAKERLVAALSGNQAGAGDVLATTLGNLASTFQAPGEFEQARSLYAQAMELRRSISGNDHLEIAQWSSNLALLLSETGQEEAALQSSEASLRMRKCLLQAGHPDIVRSLLEVGWLRTRLGDLDTAAGLLLEAILLLSTLETPTILARAYFLLASLLSERGELSAAIFFEKRSVNLLQGLRGSSASYEGHFLAAREAVYRHLAESLLRAGRLPEALQIVAMIKEFELEDLTNGVLTPTILAQFTQLEQAQLDDEAQWRADLAEGWHERTPLDTEAIAGDEVATMRDWFTRLRNNFSAAPVRERRPPLAGGGGEPVGSEDGSLHIQYLLADDHLQAVVSSREGLAQFERHFPSGHVHRLVLGLRASIAGQTDEWLAHARALHELLLEPVAERLNGGGVEHLSFSLDGILRYLPPGVLHDGRQHLLQRCAPSIAASTGRSRPAGKLASDWRVAGFGVTKGLGGHRPLQGAREELHAVVRSVESPEGAVAGRIFLDEAFTGDALRDALRQRFNVIHIASHFVFRPARQGESYLLLGDGSRLPLAELAELAFDSVELLTLSACDTAVGGGHTQSGGEFEGLGSIALRRGARHVIATLWPIRDFTSAAVMRELYHLRFREGHSIASALRQAQQMILTGQTASRIEDSVRGLIDPDGGNVGPDASRKSSHPYFWAPYVLME